MSEIKLVWVYDDGNSTYPDKIVFGSRRDAMLFAYHQAFDAIYAAKIVPKLDEFLDQLQTVAEQLRENPIEKYFDDLKVVYERIIERSQEAALTRPERYPTRLQECAELLRSFRYDYMIDDHVDNSDRWVDGTRVNDLEEKCGDINISVHDEHGLIRWHNFFDIDINQYILVDQLDEELIKRQKKLLDSTKGDDRKCFVLPMDGTLTMDFFTNFQKQAKVINEQALERIKDLNVVDVPKGTNIYYSKEYEVYSLEPIEEIDPIVI